MVFTWQRAETAIRDAIAGLAPEETLALMIDEVPWWLDGIVKEDSAAEARRALGRLRNLRQKDWDGRSLVMVLTGSVGLAGIAKTIGATAELNDLLPQDLGPLSLQDGALLFDVQILHQTSTCSGNLAEQACGIAGGSPHWIKMLANRMAPGRDLVEQDLQDAVESLLSPRMRHLFEDEARGHFVRRYGAERAQVLRSILSVASHSESGANRQSLITKALAGGIENRDDAEEAVWSLVDSFHLEQEGDVLRFSNPLFRLWWLRYGGEA